jgi:hypothetical protein
VSIELAIREYIDEMERINKGCSKTTECLQCLERKRVCGRLKQILKEEEAMPFDPEKVKRFDGGHGGGMIADVAGMYIHVADYRSLLALYRELKAKQEAISKLDEALSRIQSGIWDTIRFAVEVAGRKGMK